MHHERGPELHRQRPHQRHPLHLHRDRHQRRRHRAGLGALGVGHAAPVPRIRLDSATYPDLAGYPNDRYGTDAAVAEQAFGSGASTVYIASGANFPDALGAGAAAAQAGGPVLLVTPTSIPAAIAHELTALHPTTIYVVGGTAASRWRS